MAPLSVLVTGSSGFIGTRVVRHLHAAGQRVTGLDHIPPKDPLPEGAAFHVCDIRKGELPDRTFDAVVPLAARASVRPSLDRPTECPGSANVNGADPAGSQPRIGRDSCCADTGMR